MVVSCSDRGSTPRSSTMFFLNGLKVSALKILCKIIAKKFCSVNNLAYLCSVIMKKGKMAEWSNVSHSKCDVGVTLPGVRIPLIPQQI